MKMNQEYELTRQELEIRCNKLILIRTFIKHGLGYFEPIVFQIKKTGKIAINKDEFDRNIELAKDKILEVYQQEKDKQKAYNNNRNKNSDNQSQSSPNVSNQITDLPTQDSSIYQSLGDSNQSFQSGKLPQIIRVNVMNQLTQTDDDWIKTRDSEVHKLIQTTEQIVRAKQKLESDQLQMKSKESRLNITIDKRDKELLKYKDKITEYESKQKQFKKAISDLNDRIIRRDQMIEEQKKQYKHAQK